GAGWRERRVPPCNGQSGPGTIVAAPPPAPRWARRHWQRRGRRDGRCRWMKRWPSRCRSNRMPDLPSGTVTFLFTDIEGSTRLWEQYPEAMQTALARHDALLAPGIRQHGGGEGTADVAG